MHRQKLRVQKHASDMQIRELEQRLAVAVSERDEHRQTAERCRAETDTMTTRLDVERAAMDKELTERKQVRKKRREEGEGEPSSLSCPRCVSAVLCCAVLCCAVLCSF